MAVDEHAIDYYATNARSLQFLPDGKLQYEKAFRPDVPVANCCKQRSNDREQQYLANLFAQHRKLYR